MTAMPYGINTVSLFAYIIFIMSPDFHECEWRNRVTGCNYFGR